MGFDSDKDKFLKLFEKEDETGGALLCSIFSYDGGEPKLQITRRYLKRDQTNGYGKMGRLTIEEVEWIKDNIDSILTVMTNKGE